MAERNNNQLPSRVKDETGKVYGHLTVIGIEPGQRRRAAWRCRCECGNECVVVGVQLRSGNNTTCGCQIRKHGHAREKTGATPEYQCWVDMRTRCNDARSQSYASYGGRGVAVCDSWNESFTSFFADMGSRPSQKHSIDRIDNDGDYCPENCRWATKSEQRVNQRKRTRTTKFIEYNGDRRSCRQWALSIGLNPSTLYARIFVHGWDIERALTTPRGA